MRLFRIHLKTGEVWLALKDRSLRSININFDSIKFLNKEDIQKLSKIEIISSYLNDKIIIPHLSLIAL